MKALEHLLVLDLTRLLPGSVATQMLAGYGARVIKIEQPGVGDYARHGFGSHGTNPLFLATNRNKQSLALDLKPEEGKAVLRHLAERADFLIESFRPGVMDRLGLGYEALKQINPKLIYVALTGYGQSGELSQMAGHDINYLGMAGVLSQIGTPAQPVIPGVQLADLAGGSLPVVIGALTALEARHRTGVGQFVDVSMTEGVAALLPVPLSMYEASHHEPRRGNELLSGRYACYNLYQASDGRWLTVGALEQKFWVELCQELDCADLAGEQFAPEPRQSEIKARIAAAFATRTATEWFDLLRDKDCCVAPMKQISEIAAHGPYGLGPKLNATPAAFTDPAPGLGEHSAQVLAEFGYSASQIHHLKTTGIIG